MIHKTAALQDRVRAQWIEAIHARIACLDDSGADRSLSRKTPGVNHLLPPKGRADAQFADAVAPVGDKLVLTKTTDSA
ncbi:hypothetical protein [Salipiger pallidus]|uniref:hypothetical protein n=1 Tax=Salipiger pallidus TaxID=1775170 RepID=UPI001E3DC84E|nr:hypothetical protein [Salipiger pallidus]